MDIDPWHYVGDSEFFKNPIADRFKQFILQKYPKIKIPIKVGPTGYIVATEKIDPSVCGWSLDELERFVCIVDEKLFFSRYQNGDLIMYGNCNASSYSNEATQDIFNSIMNK